MKWKTVKRKISNLIPHPKNPRQMTEKQVADLTASLKKFDLVEIPVVNIGGQLLAGHQRLKIMALLGRSEEVIDVRIPTKKLSEKDCEEYLLRSNKNTGGWDFDMLANEYEVEELSEWGFEEEMFIGIPSDNEDINEEAMKDTHNECPKCGFSW